MRNAQLGFSPAIVRQGEEADSGPINGGIFIDSSQDLIDRRIGGSSQSLTEEKYRAYSDRNRSDFCNRDLRRDENDPEDEKLALSDECVSVSSRCPTSTSTTIVY